MLGILMSFKCAVRDVNELTDNFALLSILSVLYQKSTSHIFI